MENDDYEIDIREFFSMFLKNIKLIIIWILLFLIIGIVYVKMIKVPEYTSSATLILVSKDSSDENSTNTTSAKIATDLNVNSRLVSTYSELIKSKNVLRTVENNLKIDKSYENTLRKNISVTSESNTELIRISVTDKDPQLAYNVTNEITKVFSSKVEEIYNIDNVHIVDKAQVPKEPSNNNNTKEILLAAVIGLVISIIHIIIKNLLDTTIKTEEEVENNCDSHVVAMLPVYNKKNVKEDNGSELITLNDPKSPISESFRTLRTNIQFMNMNKDIKCLLITSSFPGEGKSWVSSNLAITFAQLGQKVLLIDADLRKGRLYKVFETAQKPGLSNYLSKMTDSEAGKKENFDDIVKKTIEPNLYFIPSGTFPPNPSELLISSQMKALVEGLQKYYDIVIIDGTPCQLVTDARIIARLADTTVVVAEYNKTKKEVLKNTIKSIKGIGGNIAGVVINKIPKTHKNYYGNYESGYYYGSTNTDKKKHHNIENTKDKIDRKSIEINKYGEQKHDIETESHDLKNKTTDEEVNYEEKIKGLNENTDLNDEKRIEEQNENAQISEEEKKKNETENTEADNEKKIEEQKETNEAENKTELEDKKENTDFSNEKKIEEQNKNDNEEKAQDNNENKEENSHDDEKRKEIMNKINDYLNSKD